MATLRPFRAVRPVPGMAAAIASPPYDVVTTEEARAIAAASPASFLRVTRPEIEFGAGTDPHADGVYDRGRHNFAELVARGSLVRETAPALYLYRLQRGDHTQTGIAGTFAVDEIERGIIK